MVASVAGLVRPLVISGSGPERALQSLLPSDKGGRTVGGQDLTDREFEQRAKVPTHRFQPTRGLSHPVFGAQS